MAPAFPLITGMYSSLTLLYSLTNYLSFIQSFAAVTLTMKNIARYIETPYIHPNAGSLMTPEKIVRRAQIASTNRILSSRASLMLSIRGGICGKGLVLRPKNLILLSMSLSFPIIPVSASVANFLRSPSLFPYLLSSYALAVSL